jgi:hypothetical protein
VAARYTSAARSSRRDCSARRHSRRPRPERSFALDAALTAAWREAAPEVVFSSAHAEGDRELLVSALAGDVPLVDPSVLAIPSYPSRRDALFAAGRNPGAIAPHRDALAPPHTGAAKGGTGILVDQAACPFVPSPTIDSPRARWSVPSRASVPRSAASCCTR